MKKLKKWLVRNPHPKVPDGKTSSVHREMWEGAPKAVFGTEDPTPPKAGRGRRSSLQSAGMPGNEEADPPRLITRPSRTRI
jgi:hypothetical protein